MSPLRYLSHPPTDIPALTRWWRWHARVAFVTLLLSLSAIYNSITMHNRWLVLLNCAICYSLCRTITTCVHAIKVLTYRAWGQL